MNALEAKELVVVKIEARHGRVFRSGRARYFLLRHKGELHAVPDACAHRGGPLSKGSVDECKGTVTCPMHQLKTSLKLLMPKALPAVRVGTEVRVVCESETVD